MKHVVHVNAQPQAHPLMSSGWVPRHEWPLLFAIFLDLAGFGMLLPDVQTRLEAFGARGWQIGGVFTAYFLVQMLCSPAWGQLSDRIGRKPILIVCGVLSAGSMLVYALAHGIGWVLASRILAGFGGANVVVAQAYLADATDEPNRAAAMGRMGAATTGGLILGPALGGWLAAQGSNVLVGGVAASASALGALWIWLSVPRDARSESKVKPRQKFFDLSLLRDTPSLRPLFVVAALAFFVLACLEGTFGRLIRHKLGYGPKEFGLIFGYEALLNVVVQGVLLDKISHRIAPSLLLRLSYLLQGVGLALMPFMPNLFALFGASTLFAIGTACANPTLNTLCSEATPQPRQGEMFGLLQSTRSLGFLVGPLLGGVLFDWRPEVPYLLAGIVSVGVAVVAARNVIGTMEKATFQPQSAQGEQDEQL